MRKTGKAIMTMLMAGVVLTGCGKAKPEGTYTYTKSNVEISFTFDGDMVSTNLDDNNEKCNYKIDNDGKIEFIEGEDVSAAEDIECSYDAERDVVIFQGIEFQKIDEKAD